jgi:hypothetical protein
MPIIALAGMTPYRSRAVVKCIDSHIVAVFTAKRIGIINHERGRVKCPEWKAWENS